MGATIPAAARVMRHLVACPPERKCAQFRIDAHSLSDLGERGFRNRLVLPGSRDSEIALATVLGIEHRILPPSLHFHEPESGIDFSATPFYMNAHVSDWRCEGPRRARDALTEEEARRLRCSG
jgi:acyl transferase domain-containing protein